MINELGIIGNIERLQRNIIDHQNKFIQERVDTENAVIDLEQEATDAYLNNVETQQLLTELELMIIGGNNDI